MSRRGDSVWSVCASHSACRFIQRKGSLPLSKSPVIWPIHGVLPCGYTRNVSLWKCSRVFLFVYGHDCEAVCAYCPCITVLLRNVCARCRTLSRRGHFVLTHAWADSGAVLLLCSPGRHVFQADNFNDYGESCSLRCGSSKCACTCELKVFNQSLKFFRTAIKEITFSLCQGFYFYLFFC